MYFDPKGVLITFSMAPQAISDPFSSFRKVFDYGLQIIPRENPMFTYI
jgi:hypothetical protein